jgi:hypothetical protein
MLRSIQTPANGNAMNNAESSPPKRPRSRATASVKGSGAIAQGKGALALGKGASYVGGDSYQITLQQAARDRASRATSTACRPSKRSTGRNIWC